MNSLEFQLRKATSDVKKVGAKFAVVGGLAVSARAEPRMTRDADLAIAVQNDSEAEQIVRAMQDLGYSVLAAVEQDAVGRLSTVRLVTDASSITDLLFASTGIENEIVDLRALREVATEPDWLTAETAVDEIEKRGYARGRDLAQALITLRESGAY